MAARNMEKRETQIFRVICEVEQKVKKVYSHILRIQRPNGTTLNVIQPNGKWKNQRWRPLRLEKSETSISRLEYEIETKFKRLLLHYIGPVTQ